MGLESAEVPQPYRFRLSTGIAQRLGEPLLLSLQLDRDRGADPRLASGFEWTVIPALRLRAGMQHPFSQTDVVNVFSNGFGVQSGRFQMDYAVRYAQEFSPEHLLTLRFQLGDESHALQQQDEVPEFLGAATPQVLTPELPAVDLPEVATSADKPASAPTQAPALPSVPKDAPQAQSRTLPVGVNDGLPAPPRPSASTTLSVPSASSVQYVVRAGVHSDMDAAALEIARFYRAEIRPQLERRGALFIVVVKRCSTREEAQEWLSRAQDAGLQCAIDEE